MGNIPPVSGTAGVPGVAPAQQAPRTEQAEPRAAEDQVEISSLAQSLSTLEPQGDIRVDKVMAIREAIRNGTYETPEKIDATVEKLLHVLRG